VPPNMGMPLPEAPEEMGTSTSPQVMLWMQTIDLPWVENVCHQPRLTAIQCTALLSRPKRQEHAAGLDDMLPFHAVCCMVNNLAIAAVAHEAINVLLAAYGGFVWTEQLNGRMPHE